MFTQKKVLASQWRSKHNKCCWSFDLSNINKKESPIRISSLNCLCLQHEMEDCLAIRRTMYLIVCALVTVLSFQGGVVVFIMPVVCLSVFLSFPLSLHALALLILFPVNTLILPAQLPFSHQHLHSLIVSVLYTLTPDHPHLPVSSSFTQSLLPSPQSCSISFP